MLVRFINGVLRVPEGTDAPGGAAAAAPAVPVQPAAPPPTLPNGAPPADEGSRTQTFKQMLDSATAKPDAPAQPQPPAQPPATSTANQPAVNVTQPSAPKQEGQEPAATPPADGSQPGAEGGQPATSKTPSALDVELDDDFDFDAPPSEPKAAGASGEEGEPAASREEENEIWKSIKEISLDDITNDPEVADRVRGALFKTGRGRRMLQHHSQMNELARPHDEGGIGFTPTNDQIRDMYARSAAFEDLSADLEEASSDPTKAERLLNFMLNGAEGPRESAVTLAQKFPAVLAKVAPQAFQGLQSAMLSNYLRVLDMQAQRAPNEQDRAYAAKLRDALAYNLGQYNPDQAQQPGQPAPGQHRTKDPELERLMRENAEMREQLSGAERANLDSYIDNFLGDSRSVVSDMLDKALPDVRTLLGGDAIAAPYLRDRIDDVLDRVSRDRLFMQNIERRVQRAYQSRDQQARDQALADFKKHVRSHVLPVARSIQEALRNSAGAKKPVDVAANAALHQNMAARQADAAAEGQGAPAPVATSPNVEWNPKLGATANFKNILNAIPR